MYILISLQITSLVLFNIFIAILPKFQYLFTFVNRSHFIYLYRNYRLKIKYIYIDFCDIDSIDYLQTTKQIKGASPLFLRVFFIKLIQILCFNLIIVSIYALQFTRNIDFIYQVKGF